MIAIHMWLALVKRWQQDRLTVIRSRAAILLAILPAFCTMIPFAGGNIGYELSSCAH